MTGLEMFYMVLLDKQGIQCQGVVRCSRNTVVKTRVVAHNQQVVRFDREDKDGLNRKISASLFEFIQKAIPNHDAVIISDYKKGVISSELIKEVLKTAKLLHIFVSVDPKVGQFEFYKGVSLITPNLAEASLASRIEIKGEKSLISAGKRLLKTLSCNAVLITRGEQGMSLFEKEKVTHIPTVTKDVYDQCFSNGFERRYSRVGSCSAT